MFNLEKCEKGSALLLAVMILFIFLTLGFAVTAMISSEIKISTNNVRSTQAFYVAEAGIAEAINVLYSNPSVTGTIIDKMSIGNGLVTVTGSWLGNVITLESIGRVGGAKRTVKQNVKVEVGSSIFDNALTTFADSNGTWLELKNNVEITGDLKVGVNVGINRNVTVNGILHASQKPAYNDSPNSVQIKIDHDLELPEFPEIPEWQKPAGLGDPKVYGYVNDVNSFRTGDKYFSADAVELNDSLELNDVYIECSYLKLGGNKAKYAGVTFVVDGAINIDGNDKTFYNVNLIAKSSININSNHVDFKQGVINARGAINVSMNNGEYEDVQVYSHDYILFSQNTKITRGIILCYGTTELQQGFELAGHLLTKGWLDIKNNAYIYGSLGAGGATVDNNSVLIHSKDTGAPIPSTISTGTKITKLKWSEGTKPI